MVVTLGCTGRRDGKGARVDDRNHSTGPHHESRAGEDRSEPDRALKDNPNQGPTSSIADQSRLRALLQANQAVTENLDLPLVLQCIVEAAVDLVDAQYGALGVIDPVHGGLERFVYQGVSSALAKKIGHLPEGQGLLGAVIDEARPIRLEHLSEDDRSVGFPPHHPPMDSFLGVPVRIHDEVFGNLYLTNQQTRGRFSPEDEELVGSLAATAGYAIQHAQLFAETQRRQRWAAVTAEITATLVSADGREPVAMIAERVLDVSGAAHVRIVVPTEDSARLSIKVARGIGADVEGTMVPVVGSVAGAVLEGMNPRLIDDEDFDHIHPLLPDGHAPGSIIAVPLVANRQARGVLLAVRETSAPRFTRSELEMVADFAGQVTLAMELADARNAQQQMLIYEDRSRIARDLHDHVIQQLFASGLELQSVVGTLTRPSNIERVSSVVDTLDSAIAQIRTIIFSLASPRTNHTASLRHQIIDLVNEFDGGLNQTPAVTFTGPVDFVITGDLADDVTAVVREALANIAKHANARSASITIAVGEGAVKVDIEDDGVGFRPDGRRSGLANLEERAAQRGGRLILDSGAAGTRLHWSIPFATGQISHEH